MEIWGWKWEEGEGWLVTLGLGYLDGCGWVSGWVRVVRSRVRRYLVEDSPGIGVRILGWLPSLIRRVAGY